MKKTLYQKGKKGEIREWSVWTEGDTAFSEFGLVGGKLQVTSYVCAAKNEGKTNETTPEQQAILEAEALYIHKLERKYSKTIEETEEISRLPMLAHSYDKSKHDVTGWYVQPKLDGVRCIAMWEDDHIVLLSRQGKVYNVPHISEELESFLPKDTIFDGELYVHGSSLESTISLVKKYKPESINLEYHVYDAPLVMGAENLPFKERYLTYVALIVVHTETYKTNPKVIGVLSKITKTGEEQETCFGENLEAGYEGSILRNPESTYVWKHRSKDLLKVKQFVDEEFEVIGYKEGIGRMKGAIIFTCKNNTNPDQTFDVLPKTTIENRAKMFENGDSYIGRKYTVKFFDRTDNGLPRDPIGLAFREDI